MPLLHWPLGIGSWSSLGGGRAGVSGMGAMMWWLLYGYGQAVRGGRLGVLRAVARRHLGGGGTLARALWLWRRSVGHEPIV
eukprot:scaffold15779_cov31-Tisochrysis_lutea.AAC.3